MDIPSKVRKLASVAMKAPGYLKRERSVGGEPVAWSFRASRDSFSVSDRIKKCVVPKDALKLTERGHYDEYWCSYAGSGPRSFIRQSVEIGEDPVFHGFEVTTGSELNRQVLGYARSLDHAVALSLQNRIQKTGWTGLTKLLDLFFSDEE